MKIIIAKEAGFCYGVKKAVNILEDLSEKGRIFTFGALIHNPQYIEKLKSEGIGVKENISEIESGDTIIIRSHGVSEKVLQEISSKGAKVIDATCPFVKNAQLAAKRLEKEGYDVVVIGDPLHPEIKGIVGNLKNGKVIKNLDSFEDIKCSERVGIISQTTLDRKDFEEITKKFIAKYAEVKVVDTICSASKEKQEETRNLAGDVDVLIVIGGKNSANTTHLKEIAEKITKTYHIESADEVDADWFLGIETVGITAGASTPDYLIEELAEKIKEFI